MEAGDAREQLLKRLEQHAAGTFWDYLGCKLVTLGHGLVVISLEVMPHHLNPIGILHGGVSASLLDNAMGIAAMLRCPDEKVVTSNLDVHYLAPIREGIATATAEIIHQSRRTITTQAKIMNSDKQICVFGTGSFRIS